MLTFIENCRVSPPAATLGERSLPITFFDAVWLTFTPVHQLFFYDFPHPTQEFTQTLLPKLKHSLSLTLRHFWPFAGNLIMFSDKRKPEIRYVDGDSIAFAVAESDLDFNDLVGNHPRDCEKFYPLVPSLGRVAKVFDVLRIPLFSVQVTFFPNAGFSIGMTNYHVLCDATPRFLFLKAWASISTSGTDDILLQSGALPLYDRVIEYPSVLDEIYFNPPGIENLVEGYQLPHLVGPTNKVRVTLIMTRTELNSIKKWVLARLPSLEYVSSFVIVCAYTWSCEVKSRIETKGGDEDKEGEELFLFAADCRGRLDPPIPQTYFGNCGGPCFAVVKADILSGKEGFLMAAESIREGISKLGKSEGGVTKEAATWFGKLVEYFSMPPMGVAGTPKLKFYDVDFGSGRPRKIETVSIDYNSSISLNACKDSPEDLEIGISMNAKQMEVFLKYFREGMNKFYE